MPLPEEIPQEIAVRGLEAEFVSVEDFANFLRDLVFLHDRIWIIASGREKEYDLKAGYFYTRYGRPVPADQRLQLVFARKGSPWEIGILIASAPIIAATAWGFVQAIRALILLPGEFRKQNLEIEKIKTDIGLGKHQAQLALDDAVGELASTLEVRGERGEVQIRLLRRDIERISENKLVITEVEVRRTVGTKPK